MNITVYDFTGIYEDEGFDFYKEESSRSLLNENTYEEVNSGAGSECGKQLENLDARQGLSKQFEGSDTSQGRDGQLESAYVSLKNISGTNCICDDYGCEEIRRRIPRRGKSVSFFDNGNYHYMSKLLMDVLCEEAEDKNLSFDLVVFDHHTDMKWTSYGEVLSCGSWILNSLKDRPELGKVFIIGADADLITETKTEFPEYEGRVFFFDDISGLEGFEISKVYISVDKDVLSKDELSTNWDQGEMSIAELEKALKYLKERFGSDILAIDVCGESLYASDEAYSELGIEASNRVNRMILEVL